MPVILGGNTGIYLASLAPAFDPDAQAFITAAAITDPTQQAAINTLVVDLKGYSIWTKMKALYPFVGGTSTTHKFNLKNPLDTDAAFRLVFNGGWTHSSNGATPNGTNGYADTKLATTGNIAQNSGSMGVYSRTNTSTTGAHGSRPLTNTNLFELFERWTDNNFYCYLNDSGGFFGPSILDSRGFNQGSRTASNEIRYNRNTTTNTGITASTGTNTLNIWIGASNQNNSGTYWNNREIAFYYIGDGLTNTEMQNFYTAVQAFQVTIGRSIGTQTVSDADAQAFVTAADIQDQVEANAINNLVIGMKADGTWSKMKAVYPFVGGTNTSNSYNLRNTAQYQIAWGGSVTSNSNGVTFGANGYGNTNLNPNTQFSTNDSMHLSAYSRTNNDLGGLDFGGLNASAVSGLYLRYSNNAYAYINGGAGVLTPNTDSTGFYVGTRTASNVLKLFKNTAQLGSTYTGANGGRLDLNAFLGAVNVSNIPQYYTQRNYAFASIGDGLTDTEAANLYTRVQNFNTALARQV